MNEEDEQKLVKEANDFYITLGKYINKYSGENVHWDWNYLHTHTHTHTHSHTHTHTSC